MGNRGFVMILALILQSCLLLMGMFLLDHFVIQRKITNNLYYELKTYYLAKAGVEYTAARLGREPDWRADDWQIDLRSNGQISISISDQMELIQVESLGTYAEARCLLRVFFTKIPPIEQIK